MGKNNGDDDNVERVPFTKEDVDKMNKENDKLAKDLGFNVPDEQDWPDGT